MAEQSNAATTVSETSKIKEELQAAAKKGFQEVHDCFWEGDWYHTVVNHLS